MARRRSLQRERLRCLIGHQPDYTRTTQALPGGNRSQPVTAGSPAEEMPALAGNSRSEPVVAVGPVPVCHAGGRGFESRCSRKTPCKLACCVVRRDARSAPNTHCFSKRRRDGRKRAEMRSRDDDFKPIAAELMLTAKAACDYTKRPEVTAARPVASEFCATVRWDVQVLADLAVGQPDGGQRRPEAEGAAAGVRIRRA
jgi:hypothetical protein